MSVNVVDQTERTPPIETKLGPSINMNRDSLRRQRVQQCGGEPSRTKVARTSGSSWRCCLPLTRPWRKKARNEELVLPDRGKAE